MGPRLCSRGEESTLTYQLTLIETSQWGHGFVAVESPEIPVPPRNVNEPSQWGHGFVAVERPEQARALPSQLPGRNGATAL